jgi:adenosine deaminase
MIKCFEIFLPVVRGNLNLLEDLAYDFCRRQAQQRVVYTEARYSPHLFAEGAQLNQDSNTNIDDNDSENPATTNVAAASHLLLLHRAEEVLLSITKGLRRGSSDFGITVHQILCAITWRPDWAMHVVDLAEKYRHDMPCAVVGVDIAAGEEHFDQEKYPDLFQPHYDMMQRAKSLRIPITLHAGEVGLAENVTKAVHDYGATRIGHGYCMLPATRKMLSHLNQAAIILYSLI